MGTLWALWEAISDPERFIIDHWPMLLAGAFLASLPWMWTSYMALIRSRTVQVLVVIGVGIGVAWSLRGRWDNDQFDKERASFRTTIQAINADHQNKVIAAEVKARQDAETNRKVLADAIADAAARQGQEKGRADTLQAAIDKMPDLDVPIAPTKDCPKPPKRQVDPVLLQILRGK